MVTSNLDNYNTLLLLHRSAKLGEELKGFILKSEKVYLSVPRVVIHDDIPIVLPTETSCGDRSKQIHM